MFSFEKENPSRIVATATLEIQPDWQCNPLVWTVQFKPVLTRRVYIVFTTNQKGRQTIRFYPLQKDPSKPFPAFIVCSHQYAIDDYTHVCLEHKNFKIIRTLKSVYYSMLQAKKNREVDIFAQKLITLMKHLYFRDAISDELVKEIEEKFIKHEKLISRALSTQFEHEADICLRKAWDISLNVEEKLTKIVRRLL